MSSRSKNDGVADSFYISSSLGAPGCNDTRQRHKQQMTEEVFVSLKSHKFLIFLRDPSDYVLFRAMSDLVTNQVAILSWQDGPQIPTF